MGLLLGMANTKTSPNKKRPQFEHLIFLLYCTCIKRTGMIQYIIHTYHNLAYKVIYLQPGMFLVANV